MRWDASDELRHVEESIEIGEFIMAKQQKQYEVTFAQGTPQQVTYPIEATSKKEAALEFSHQYIGRRDTTLAELVKVTQVQPDEE
jgi:hypothetical protein